MRKIADKKLGVVTHYYDKIGVAVIKITSGDLKVGDNIRLVAKNGETFEQGVSSMQIEHADIEIAKKGDEFGLKVDRPLKDNSDVTKA